MRFALNQHNQLIIKTQRQVQPLTVYGRFFLERRNQLNYVLNGPSAWRQKFGLPNKIKFKGNWRLNSEYNLELHLSKASQQFKGDVLSLRGKILRLEGEGLVFQIKNRNRRGVNKLSLLKFSGVWLTDKFNRINFKLKKSKGANTLIFENTWSLNKNQQVIYRYKKTDLKTKRKVKNSLIFTGFWQIPCARRLVYNLSGSSRSHFELRAHFQTANIYPKRGAIKFRIGAGMKKNLGAPEVIALYGAWKFSRKLGVYFEMNYGQDQIKRLVFNAQVNLTHKDKVIFKLTDKKAKSIGISLAFSHRFLSKLDAQWLLRLKRNAREKGVETKVSIPF